MIPGTCAVGLLSNISQTTGRNGVECLWVSVFGSGLRIRIGSSLIDRFSYR